MLRCVAASWTCSDTVVIEFKNISLWRRTQEEYSYDLKRTIFAVIKRRYRPPTRRRVLNDLSFTVRRGEKVGIIGPNGSGKSTTLKLIAGILKPTSGSIRVDGDVAPLIELGAGFDPDLSVVENIMYYGVLLGRSRAQVRAGVDGVLDFSGLFDHANEPLKALSSGMVARLGFALATETRPDILILDEVLSVGDEAFRRKSWERLQRFWDERSTILLVSHEAQAVKRMCDRALLLEEGQLIADGSASEVSDLYLERIGTDVAVVGHSATHLTAEAIQTMEGRIFRGNGSSWDEQRVFIVQGGRKHWVCDPDRLPEIGLRWPQDVIFVDGGVLGGVPEGDVFLGTGVAWVDEPAENSSVRPDDFVVSGWVVPEAGKRVSAVAAVIEGETIGITDCLHARPDVDEMLSLSTNGRAGFVISCCVPMHLRSRPSLTVRIEIVDDTGGRTALSSRSVKISEERVPSA
jgi:ABC-type polysaccharide/polyol phosphate transport system ATPase subunit